MVITPFKNLIAQIGPAYDPLFYDVMVYIFGTMLFAVFLLSVIAYWLRRKGLGGGSAKEKWTQELKDTSNGNRSVLFQMRNITGKQSQTRPNFNLTFSFYLFFLS